MQLAKVKTKPQDRLLADGQSLHCLTRCPLASRPSHYPDIFEMPDIHDAEVLTPNLILGAVTCKPV